ncbi:POTRA domain-containing protein [Planktosalinus lacus]|uniref:POTRA domain-containing protein n=1 Tax=Planktosalinus lacus TaxID=1526573 RepID=UPI001667ACEA|nr:POTRA domain-containing protein [Planktosalinus lacus]
MKNTFFLFLYLYIYTSVFTVATGQNIQLDVEGKDSTETNVIKSHISKLEYSDFNSLKTELDSLEYLLQKQGYIELERKNILRTSDSSFQVLFALNKKYEYIYILNPEILSEYGFKKREIERFSTSDENNLIKINFETIESTLNYINQTISERGFPFVQVSLKQIKPETRNKNTLQAFLEIESTSKRTISKITVKGYEKFPKAFLKHSIGLKKGILFQKEKISSQSLLLDNFGFVKNIKPPEVLFTKEQTELFLYLEKTPNNLFDGILGFNTNEESNKIELNGYLNLELSNNLNFGERLELQYKNDGEDQEQFKVKLELPYLFQSPVGIEAGLELFKRDSTFSTVEKNILTNYQFNTKTKVFIGYKDYESNSLQEETLAGNPLADFNSSYFVFGGNYRKPQSNFIFPYKTTLNLSNEIGTRTEKNQKTNQYKINLIANHIFNFNDINSIFVNNSTSYLASDNYLTNELFRFGGINSIRGFNENSIDASLLSVLNTEYRYLLNYQTYIHSIVDYAYFENPIVNIKSQLYSFGVGIGLNTKAGVFRFNVANGTAKGQEFRFSNTKIHLSLNSKF